MTTTIPAGTAALAGTWNLDAVHSTLGFSVKHMLVATFRGSFNEYSVSLDATGETPKLTGTVTAASIVTADENLFGHLLSPEFFDAERHPELSFASTAFEVDGDEVVVRGALTIRGTSNDVELRGTVTGPITDPYGNERVGLHLHTTIDRSAYGLEWNAPMPGGGFVLSNDVRLDADIELLKTAA